MFEIVWLVAWLFQQSFKRVPDIVVSSDFVQCFGIGISSKCSAELQLFSHVDVQSGHHRIETRMGTNTARDLSKHRRSGRAQTIRDKNTVDGRNPAPVDMVNIPLFTGCHTCWLVQDFLYQQYHRIFYDWAKSPIWEHQNSKEWSDLRIWENHKLKASYLSSCTTNDSFVEGHLSSSHLPLYQKSILLRKTFVKRLRHYETSM